MAKCEKCGRHGLFLRVNKEGLCRKCEEEALEKQIEALRKRREDEQGLLREAVDRAEKSAEEQTQPLLKRIAELRESREALLQTLEADAKKEASLTAKIEKLNRLAKSAKNAIDTFPYSYNQSELEAIINNMDALVPPLENLECLSMKDLRAQYRKTERAIKETYEAYQKRYTTKANATLYKLMVLALQAELQLILKNLSFGKLEDAEEKVKKLTATYYLLIADGNQTIAPTLNRFAGQIEYLYIEAVKLEYEYFVRREQAKEEQRALREQMRQEAAERKQLEQQKKKVESEEKKYLQEIERLKAQLLEAEEEKRQAITDQLKSVETQLSEVAEKKAEIINLQNGKAGTVYIISNLGAFGDHVFKVGMTRRMEPEERVNELGSASVPFPFDIHSLIFSQDAVALEGELHRRLNDKRVNKINLRKEFFDVTLDELEALVTEIDPTAPFTRTMAAEQYRMGLSLDKPLSESLGEPDGDDEDDE